MRACLRRCLFLLILILPIGCGKGYKLATVSGKVTLDDQPLVNAEVRFIPIADDKLPPSIGTTNDQGIYELHLERDKKTLGAVTGDHRVSISLDPTKDKQKTRKMMEAMGGKMPTKMGETLPAHYNRESKLTFSVLPGGARDANFDLKSDRPVIKDKHLGKDKQAPK